MEAWIIIAETVAVAWLCLAIATIAAYNLIKWVYIRAH